MLNGINNQNNNLNNLNLLNTQLTEQTEATGATNPIEGSKVNPYEKDKNYLVDETIISNDAMRKYMEEIIAKQNQELEKQNDIKNFTNLVMNTEVDMDRMNELFKNGVEDPFERFDTGKLVDNEKFLTDLNVQL